MESSSLQELEQIPGVGKTIARYMENDARRFKAIEDELRKDRPSTEFLRGGWRTGWYFINAIVGRPGQCKSLSGSVPFTITESDVSNVAWKLEFELKCEKIANHYNSILRANPNWRKMRCPRFICTTVPIVNITSFPLLADLHSVFK